MECAGWRAFHAGLGRVVRKGDLAADDRLDPRSHGSDRELQRREHVVRVGHGHGGHGMRDAKIDQLLHRHRAFEKRVFGVGPKVDVSGGRAGHGQGLPALLPGARALRHAGHRAERGQHRKGDDGTEAREDGEVLPAGFHHHQEDDGELHREIDDRKSLGPTEKRHRRLGTERPLDLQGAFAVWTKHGHAEACGEECSGKAEDGEGLPAPTRGDEEGHASGERDDADRHEEPRPEQDDGAHDRQLGFGGAAPGQKEAREDEGKSAADPEGGGGDVHEFEKYQEVHGKIHCMYANGIECIFNRVRGGQ